MWRMRIRRSDDSNAMTTQCARGSPRNGLVASATRIPFHPARSISGSSCTKHVSQAPSPPKPRISVLAKNTLSRKEILEVVYPPAKHNLGGERRIVEHRHDTALCVAHREAVRGVAARAPIHYSTRPFVRNRRLGGIERAEDKARHRGVESVLWMVVI